MSATTTAAENSYNLRTARERVAAQLGVDSRNLSYEQQITYMQTLAGFILQYPNGFTPAQLNEAATIAGRSYPELADPSFDWSEFGIATIENAPAVLGGFTNKLLWILALGVVAWVVVRFWPRGPTPSPASA